MKPQKTQAELRIQYTKAIWRYAMARQAFLEVEDTCQRYIELNDTLPWQVRNIFTSSAIVTYCRLLVDSRKNALGALPDKFHRFEDAKMQECHDKAMEARHAMYAHTDVELYDAKIGIRVEAVEGGYTWRMKPDNLMRFSADMLPVLKTVATFQARRTEEAFNEIFGRLFPPVTLHRMLVAERNNYTEFELKWPKAVTMD